MHLLPAVVLLAPIAMVKAQSLPSWGLSPALTASQSLVIPDTAEAFRVPQSYFTGLLRKALIRGADGRAVPLLIEQPVFEQGRAITELIRGRLVDVYWMGTNRQRETELRAIPIPLLRGLVGFRRFVIRKEEVKAFDKIKSLDDLKKFKACQGLDWPDTQIMRTAGLPVRELANIDTVYKYLSKGICDYFPRGYFEIEYELAERANQYPELLSYPGLVLHYPFAIYYFVRRDNNELAEWIENGLKQMAESGELLDFMKQHPLTASSFPLHHPNVLVLSIPNADMEKNTDYTDTHYWFQLEDFTSPKQTQESSSYELFHHDSLLPEALLPR